MNIFGFLPIYLYYVTKKPRLEYKICIFLFKNYCIYEVLEAF